jgi:hypothetical protein
MQHPPGECQKRLAPSRPRSLAIQFLIRGPWNILALDSFLTCRAAVVRDGVTLQGSDSVFVSHELPLVRLAITGVLLSTSVQPGCRCSLKSTPDLLFEK